MPCKLLTARLAPFCHSFPMATSATFLAWGVLEFEDAYTKTGQLQYAHESLRWVADYL